MWLLCLLIAYVVVRVSEDVAATVRGHTPPRHEARMAKLRQRERGGGKPAAQSAAGRYFSGLFTDAFDSAHHRRELMRDQRDRNRERRAERRKQRQAHRHDKRDQRQDKRLNPNSDGAAEPSSEVDAPRDEAPQPQSKPTEATQRAAGPAVDPAPVPNLVADQTTDEAPAPGAEPGIEEPTKEPTPDPTIPDTNQEEPPASTVLPSFPTPGPTSNNNAKTSNPLGLEMPTVSAPTGEISGLNSAINYADDLSDWCAHTADQIGGVLPSDNDAAASCEQARAQLEEGGVTGQPLTDVSSVQEQMTAAVEALNTAIAQLEAAGAAADSLKATLTEHLSVQDAYAANPEAGHREFVTAD